MKKSLLLLFLFASIKAFAQPHIDTVSAGIKSVRTLVCGYIYNDSTGLVEKRLKEYNVKGQLTRHIWQMNSDRIVIKNNEEEPEAEGYFYRYWNYQLHTYDTMKCQYNAKFQQVKWMSRDDEKKLQEGVLAYDVNGNFISETGTINGVREEVVEWQYDASGRLVSKWYKARAFPAQKVEERRYDDSGRMVMKISFEDRGDSTVYSYSANGMQELIYMKSGSFKRMHYDVNDSLTCSVVYFKRTNYETRKFYMQLFDSTSIVRTPAGIKTSMYKFRYDSPSIETETNQYDEKGRCILSLTTINGENVRKITYTYNDVLHTIIYKRYGICHGKLQPELYGKEALKEEQIYIYNAKNQLIEERRMDGRGKLLERTIYQYKYY